MFSLVLVWCFGLFCKQKARLMLSIYLICFLQCLFVFVDVLR